MISYQEIDGDLISMAQTGDFDVIAHGLNCFNTQKKGLAPQMVKAFQTDKFPMELEKPGDINKLGQIDYQIQRINPQKLLRVVNCYIQNMWATPTNPNPFDLEAFTLCLRKINQVFPYQHIGLPKIGAGLSGGDWEQISKVIQTELSKMKITIVHYKS